MSFVQYLTNNIGPTSMGVNAFGTIVLLTLITKCNGMWYVQCVKCNKIRTDWCNSLGPQRQMFLTKLQCHHRANSCSMHALYHAIVILLAGCQSAILSSDEWHNDMNPALISTVMAPNFEIKEITSGPRRSMPIPNQNICSCPGGQGASPYNVAQHINGNRHLGSRIPRIPQVGTPYPANGTDGHGVCEMRHKKLKMGTMVEKIQPVGPSNLLNNIVQVFANRATRGQATSSIAPEAGGNATSPLHSRGSPTKGTKSEVKT